MRRLTKPHSQGFLLVQRVLPIVKSSRFLIFTGAIIVIASFLVIRASIQMTVVNYNYGSNHLPVSPGGYVYQGIPSHESVFIELGLNASLNTYSHFSFTVEGGSTVKYVLLVLDDFEKWQLGQLSPSWKEGSSDLSYWTDGLSLATLTQDMFWLIHNEDSYGKTVRFDSFLSEKSPDYFYLNGGSLLLLFGAGMLISGFFGRLQSSLDPRLTFVAVVSLYLPILIASYLVAFFYPLFTLLGLILVPAAGSFLIGFLSRDPIGAAKRIAACVLLQAGVTLGLLKFYPVYSEALLAWWKYASQEILLISLNPDPFFITVIIIAGYPILHIVLGVPISFLGTTIREILNPE